MTQPFLDRLRAGVVLCDGAMGTEIYRRGTPFSRCFDQLNLTAPQQILEIHLDYIRAGAELIETNTYGANRLKLERHGVAGDLHAINFRGAKIAKEARDITGRPVFIAGSIGPLDAAGADLGGPPHDEAAALYREQVDALVEGGVDLILFETFLDLDQLCAAVRVARAACDLPVIASATCPEEEGAILGSAAAEFAARLVDAGAHAVGVNCRVGPMGMLDTARRLAAASSVPVLAFPNAGLPAYVDGRVFYPSTPAHVAEVALDLVRGGVRLIGGCCGTTPGHIAAMRDRLTEAAPRVAAPGARAPEPAPEIAAAPVDTREPTLLARRLKEGAFPISVEVDPPKGFDPAKDLAGAVLMREKGAEFINVADSPMARVRLSALAMCVLIRGRAQADPILHFTTRDRNLMGLQSDLLGAHALGVRNILALTGDPPRSGDYPMTSAVYDLDSIGLIRLIKRLNAGVDMGNNALGEPASFFIGCALDMGASDLDAEIARFRQKVEAGADFVMSQPVYDAAVMDRFVDRFGPLPLPHLLGVLPLQSHRHAEFLHNEVPGIAIPEATRERMLQAGKDGRKEGVRIAYEMMEALIDRVDGVYLMPSFGRYEVCGELVEALARHAAARRR